MSEKVHNLVASDPRVGKHHYILRHSNYPRGQLTRNGVLIDCPFSLNPVSRYIQHSTVQYSTVQYSTAPIRIIVNDFIIMQYHIYIIFERLCQESVELNA